MSNLLLTIDVEDWFQVENFKRYIPFSSWSYHDLRVEKNIYRLLDLLDSMETKGSSQLTVHFSQAEGCQENFNQSSAISYEQDYHSKSTDGRQTIAKRQHNRIHCTFFVLGWIAERLPYLIREIHSRGHEVASHGYSHNLCYDCSNDDLKKDLSDSKKLLEDITGFPVYGYRAPSFSINDNMLKVVEECGYLYDSSYNSFGMHGRYGRLDLSNFRKYGIAVRISNTFYELPISNLRFSFLNPILSIQNFVLPWGGGGYFRLIPLLIFKKGVASILKQDNAYVFYMHPWEIDPEQPRVNEAPMSFKFRHYFNLKNCQSKLSGLIKFFKNYHFLTCHEYISSL